MVLISIIVPVYKVEKYIHQCVDSILSQTFRDFELILVDDGSPDNCPAICDEYAAKDNRVRVIHKKNSGLSSARNAGLAISSGAFIVFVDSDDWLREDALEVLLTRQQQTGADLVLCNILPVYPPEHSGYVRPATPLAEKAMTQSQMVDCLTEKHNWYYCVAWNKLYKRRIFDNLRFPVGYIHEDEAVIHRIVGQCSSIAVTPEVLYFYRQTPGSITGVGLRIQTTDKLHAYADRIVCASERDWKHLQNVSMAVYIDTFLSLYFRFTRTAETEPYFRRMDEGLKTTLPYLLKSKSVSLRHKVYLSAIHLNPKIYSTLKRLLKGE